MDRTSKINTVRLYVIPEVGDPVGSPESWRFTPFGAGHWPKPIRKCLRLGLGRSQLVVINMRYNNYVFRRSQGLRERQPNKQVQLREKLGALKPEFAFPDSTTRGPVSRPATHSRLSPVFGRRIEINGWSQNRNSFFWDTSSTWFPSKSGSISQNQALKLLIPAKPRRMCSYVADPAWSLCVHRENGSSGTAAHPRSPTLHLSTLGFQYFNQQLSPTAKEDFQWWKSAHNVLRDPQLPQQTRHSVVHGCIEHRLGSTLECIDSVRCMDNNRENTSHQRTRVRSHTQSHTPLAAEAYGSDSPGCIRKLHCSVLHQQAGRNTVNTAVQMDQEATPHVSGQPNSTPGTTHPWEIERPCKHSVTPFPDVRYRMVSTSICLPSTDTGMWNPIIGSVCNKVESQTSTVCVPCSRSISHGSRCSVNELECIVSIRIATTSSVTTCAREGPTGPVRTDPHCPTLAPGDLVPTTLRDVGTISTPDAPHSSVSALRSDPSRYVQSPATCVEGIRDTLCSRDLSVDVASHVGRPQRESTLAIYESNWRIFTA